MEPLFIEIAPGLIGGVVAGAVAVRMRHSLWPSVVAGPLIAVVAFGIATAIGCDAKPGTAERCEAPDWLYAAYLVVPNLATWLIGTGVAFAASRLKAG